MLKSSNFDHFRSYNFGLDLLLRPLTTCLIGEEIDAYDAEDAGKVSHLALDDAQPDRQLEKLEMVLPKLSICSRGPSSPRIRPIGLCPAILRGICPALSRGEASPLYQRFFATDGWSAAINCLGERVTTIGSKLRPSPSEARAR